MINLELTVREALWILSKCEVYDSTYDKVVSAFEKAMGVNQNRVVTITSGMDTNNRISCIKAVRLWTGWGLKESKDWTDGMVGRYDEGGFWRGGGNTISLTAKTPEAAENLLRDLTGLGCEGFLS
jgi:hypothetical protein